MISRRLLAQGLTDTELADPTAVVDRLLAVQAQDPRGARLAVRSRLADSVENPSASAVDEALNDRSLVVGWLNRGTLHLVRAEDYRWLHALTAPRLATTNRTRLRQEGVSPGQADRGVKLIARQLADGPATRAELQGSLESAGIPVAGQALAHILLFAALQGLILRGPMSGREQAFVLVEDWLEPTAAVDPETALPELARRYLAAHGPAGDRDLAKWAGITLGQARRGLKSIAAEPVEIGEKARLGEPVTGGDLVDLKSRVGTGESGFGEAEPVKLLGAFDPILHGWASRDWIIPGATEREVVTTNGIFRPTILAGNRIAGTWTMPSGKVKLTPFDRLEPTVERASNLDAKRVRAYLGVDPGP